MAPVFIRDEQTIESLLRERREMGLDLLDEVWNGVLHMSPPPHMDHQEIVAWLGEVFRIQTRRHGLGKVFVQVGIREPGTPAEGPRSNYRTPDLALVPAELSGSFPGAGWIENGASLLIEVRSPREEFDEKLAFYAARGVGEALWIDRKSFEPYHFRLFGVTYREVVPSDDGWLTITSARLRVRRVVAKDGTPSLAFEDTTGAGPLPPL